MLCESERPTLLQTVETVTRATCPIRKLSLLICAKTVGIKSDGKTDLSPMATMPILCFDNVQHHDSGRLYIVLALAWVTADVW